MLQLRAIMPLCLRDVKERTILFIILFIKRLKLCMLYYYLDCRLLQMKQPILVSNACRICHSDVARALAIRKNRCKCITILQPCPLCDTLILFDTLPFQARDNGCK